jgi:hypothetical protein
MWQVVSGTANLLSDCAWSVAVPTISSDRRGFGAGQEEPCRALTQASTRTRAASDPS